MKRLRPRIKVSTYLDKELYENLQELSELTKVPVSRLFDEAIEKLLKNR